MQEIVTAGFLLSFEFHQAIFGSLTILYHINLDILKVIGQLSFNYLPTSFNQTNNVRREKISCRIVKKASNIGYFWGFPFHFLLIFVILRMYHYLSIFKEDHKDIHVLV